VITLEERLGAGSPSMRPPLPPDSTGDGEDRSSADAVLVDLAALLALAAAFLRS
jgi:hypothetical protein